MLDAKEIFHSASEISDLESRAAYLDAACRGDAVLRRQVESLLDAFEETGAFLQRNAPIGTLLGEVAANRIEQGEEIGPYKLLEQIGEGGFGVVYMAQQREPISRRVALKIIKLGMDTQQVIARFEAERQALAMMDHPNVAKVFDAGKTTGGRPFFVMELVRGKSITQFCDQHMLNTRERLQLFADVCKGIQHAHQKGVIHRDIKPSNIMVTWHDDQAVPKVIDFGVAKATEHRLTEKTVFTRYAEMIGTPTYMSPEQARLGTDVDTRSDIYSLGVLLYELLSGAPPFDHKALLAADYDEMRRRICEDEPPTPSARLNSLSRAEQNGVANRRRTELSRLHRLFRGELDWIVMRAMEKDRRRRYATANLLGDDVRRYLLGDPISAAAPSKLYRMRKYVQRNQGFVSALFVIFCVFVLGAIVSVSQGIRATKNAIQAESSELATRQQLYVSDMALAQREFDDLDTRRTVELLEKHIPTGDGPDFRGFEWRWLWNQCHQEEFQLPGHTSKLRDLRASPDGSLLASASTDGTARLWDLARRKEIWNSTQLGEHCNTIDFSPNGRLLVAKFWMPKEPTAPNTLLWDISQPERPIRLRQIRIAGRVIRFSSDIALSGGGKEYDLKGTVIGDSGVSFDDHARHGQILAAFCSDHRARIWRHEALIFERPIAPFYYDLVKGVAIAPSPMNIVAIGSYEGVFIVNEDGQQIRHLLKSQDSPLSGMDFSRDGSHLAVRQYHGAIRIFETKSWREVTACRTQSPGNTVTFSPGEDLVLAGGLDGIIRAWRASPVDHVLDHPETVSTLEFAPDGTELAVGMDNGAVFFWDVENRTKLFEIEPTRSEFPRTFFARCFSGDYLAYSPDSRHVAAIGPEHVVQVWDCSRRKAVTRYEHTGESRFHSLAFSTDGSRVYVGDNDGGVHALVFQNESLEYERQMLDNTSLGVRALAATTHRKGFACGRQAGVALVEDSGGRTPNQQLPLPSHREAWPLCIDVSHDGKRLAAGDYNRGTRVWDTSTWERTDLPHLGAVLDVSFSRCGRRLASADMDANVKVWHLGTNQPIASFRGCAVDFSPDGTILAVGGRTAALDDEAKRVRLHVAPSIP